MCNICKYVSMYVYHLSKLANLKGGYIVNLACIAIGSYVYIPFATIMLLFDVK